MELRFWGVRGSCPVARPHVRLFGGNTACVQLTSGGHQLIIDAGTGIRRLGQRLVQTANGGSNHLTLLISHHHWDHIQGFPHFAPANDERFTIHLYSLRRPDAGLRELLGGQQELPFSSIPLDSLRSRLEFSELEDDDLLEVGPFKVRNYRLNHPGITCGYRVEADGGVVAYICDVAPSRDMLLAEGLPDRRESYWLRELYENQLKLANQADVVIYDTFFTPEWYYQRKHWGHSTVEDGVEVCRYASARHLFMYHHNPERTDQELACLVLRHQRELEAEEFRLHVAREGDTYQVEAGEVRLCE